ncbi:MAG: aldo/keto reductase [Clostridiales bacterium]|nr:aldo/keto reductase [Clostridiales bacterium]
MKYRKFGKTEEEVSILGFGAMRLPVKEDKTIDELKAIEMIRYGIDNGINYVDTAWPYHQGESEIVVGNALNDGYREKVYLATKLPSWLINKYEDFDYYLNEQLKKLQTNYIDFYLVHSVNARSWHNNLLANNLFKFLDEVKKDGRVKYVGFSFHDELPLFKEIVESYDWSFTQIQFNYLDHHYQAGIEGLKFAAEKGMAVIAMEPLRGGSIATDIPADIESIWKTADPNRSPVEWALRYVWNYPEISLLLSGMNTLDQVKENISFTLNADAESLTKDEISTVYKVKEKYLSKIQVNCTACQYCMPCPHGVSIPGAFKYLNDAFMFEKFEMYKNNYLTYTKEENRASICVECGECESKCPQNIHIIDELKRIVEIFEK